MTPSPLCISPSQTAALACPACAYPPSHLGDELDSPVILSPLAREVDIDWRRASQPAVPVLCLRPD